MIKINVVAVGTLKEKYWKDAVAEYAKRISRFASFKITEVPEKDTIDKEGKEILGKLSGYTVATAIEGKEISSPELASLFTKKMNEGTSEFTFVIGGSDGLSDEVKTNCNARLSFGKITLPHQLMRVVLTEQLYRALTIINNVTYHK